MRRPAIQGRSYNGNVNFLAVREAAKASETNSSLIGRAWNV